MKIKNCSCCTKMLTTDNVDIFARTIESLKGKVFEKVYFNCNDCHSSQTQKVRQLHIPMEPLDTIILWRKK